MVVIPPFTASVRSDKILGESPIQLGAQNLYWEDEGAFTGEVSAPMLKDAGCEYVVIGHSERRQYFGETDATVNKKIQAALSHDLSPILCIGESLEEREQGKDYGKGGNADRPKAWRDLAGAVRLHHHRLRTYLGHRNRADRYAGTGPGRSRFHQGQAHRKVWK